MLTPTKDGDRKEYINPQARSTRWFDHHRKVAFVNGMLNSPKDHAAAALALSLLQMCKVVGIYNSSRSRKDASIWVNGYAVAEDLIQCVGDKLQWDSSGLDRTAVNLHSWYQSKFGNPAESVQYVEQWLARNQPALTLFQYIRQQAGNPVTVFAHSQGNLITSNALTGLYLIDPKLLESVTVNSYASPAVYWPKGFKHNEYAYTLDLVPLAFGFGNSLSLRTSTIGGLSGVASHGFENYRRDDPTFVVNQFRWGALRMTASMDEDGLAEALVNMGKNMPRIYNIFKRLAEVHSSDVDDVAVLYIEKIRNRSDILKAIRSHADLRVLLIKSMDEGWTSRRESTAIQLLRG